MQKKIVKKKKPSKKTQKKKVLEKTTPLKKEITSTPSGKLKLLAEKKKNIEKKTTALGKNFEKKNSSGKIKHEHI